MSDAVKICNAASVLIGAGVIQSLEDDTDLSRIFANLYPQLKSSIMSRYPWRFLMDSFYLTRQMASPIRGWKYQFQIPGEALSGAPHAIFYNKGAKMGASTYQISGRYVLTDMPEVWAEMVIDRKEGEWPSYFQMLVVYALAANVALAVTDQQSIADKYYALAYGTPSEGGDGGEMGKAMLIDSQSHGNYGIEADHFINARRGY